MTHLYGIHDNNLGSSDITVPLPKVLAKPESSALLTSAKLKIQSIQAEQQHSTVIRKHTSVLDCSAITMYHKEHTQRWCICMEVYCHKASHKENWHYNKHAILHLWFWSCTWWSLVILVVTQGLCNRSPLSSKNASLTQLRIGSWHSTGIYL